jgi:hypothetical protein
VHRFAQASMDSCLVNVKAKVRNVTPEMRCAGEKSKKTVERREAWCQSGVRTPVHRNLGAFCDEADFREKAPLGGGK